MKIGSFVTATKRIEDFDPNTGGSLEVQFSTRGKVRDVLTLEDGTTSYLVAFEGAPVAVEVESDQVATFLALA